MNEMKRETSERGLNETQNGRCDDLLLELTRIKCQTIIKTNG